MSDNQANETEKAVRGQIGSIDSVIRIVANTTNLVNSTDIKGGDAFAVSEISNWLSSLSNELQKQRKALEDLLPKAESKKEEVKLEVVTPEPTNAPQTAS